MNLPGLGVVIFLGSLLGLLSAAESALFTLPRQERERMRSVQRPTDRVLLRLLENPRELLFSLQALTTLTIVAFTVTLSVTLSVALLEAQKASPGISLLSGTGVLWPIALVAPPLVVLLGIFLPRGLGARYPVATSHAVAIPLRLVRGATYPLWWPLRRVSEWLLQLFGVPLPEQRQLEEVQLKALVDIGQQEGTLRETERELIHNVFEFGDMTAGELMTPRTDIVGFSIDTSLREILEEIHLHRYARVPMYRSSLDSIVGILYTRDLLKLKEHGKLVLEADMGDGLGGIPASGRSLEPLLRPPWFIPSSKRADQLFREFQTRRLHVAVVVDEYGGMEGIVTMDDLLAELFGRTLDEHDVEEPEFIELGEDEWRVDAQMYLEQFCERLGLDMPDEEDITTVGGWVLALFGTLPGQGERVRHEQLEFEVEELQGTRLKLLLVRRLMPEDEPTPEEEESL